MSKHILLFIAVAFNSLISFGNVRLPAIIGSHMVLQQNSNVKIWGWADPNEKITLKADWDTATYRAVGSSGAEWNIHLKTPAAGGTHTIVITGYNKIELNDVVFGEVWVCSGQSNMEMSVSWGLPQYASDVAAATNTNIRFFYIPKTTAAYPQNDVQAKWVVCSPDEMKRFSAAGYFFGNRLNEVLNVPVGLINSNWGGTPAEVWTPANIVTSDSGLNALASKLNPSNGWPVVPGYAYNAMIYPITNYAIAGTIWYQGESNVGTWYGYRQLFTSMIAAWRKQWQKEFPFYFVQIAPFSEYGNKNDAAYLREAQTQASTFPNTGMVLTSDLVDNIKDIHPKLKKEVGIRLANYALSQTYGKSIGAYKSPLYKEMKIQKNSIRIDFENADNGLMAKGGEPTGFYISGEDKLFVPAQARIEKNSVVVWSKSVPHPVAVRFAFTNADQPNLFNKEGLPVNLFRTDQWNDISTVK